MIEQEQILCIPENGFVRGNSWTRQTLSDAWESTNWEGLCVTPWQMVASELKLTKKVSADKEGACLKERRRLSRAYSPFCQQILRLTDTLEVVRVALRSHRMEERQNPMMMNAKSESERSLRELWREKQG